MEFFPNNKTEIEPIPEEEKALITSMKEELREALETGDSSKVQRRAFEMDMDLSSSRRPLRAKRTKQPTQIEETPPLRRPMNAMDAHHMAEQEREARED